MQVPLQCHGNNHGESFMAPRKFGSSDSRQHSDLCFRARGHCVGVGALVCQEEEVVTCLLPPLPSSAAAGTPHPAVPSLYLTSLGGRDGCWVMEFLKVVEGWEGD